MNLLTQTQIAEMNDAQVKDALENLYAQVEPAYAAGLNRQLQRMSAALDRLEDGDVDGVVLCTGKGQVEVERRGNLLRAESNDMLVLMGRERVMLVVAQWLAS